MSALLARTWVPGTPRGYGTKRTEDEWLASIKSALGPYVPKNGPHNGQFTVELVFKIFPRSKSYQSQNLPHGTDLDNLVKMTVDGLHPNRGRGLGFIADDNSIYRITASKKLVSSDSKTGVWVTIAALE